MFLRMFLPMSHSTSIYVVRFGKVHCKSSFDSSKKYYSWLARIGTDSQGGTIIHELSHFTVNGGTEDYRYGPEKCLVLAQSDPLTAIMNADSHQYFAENNPAQQ
jgi:hypothetical protein